ncbi:MAG: MBL fold metallo-hydrolase [Desulfatibacillaceae bacterium]|nr:MBL fold metallo-hydrolase [Desulfatibacillaceae bacterium]
MRLKYYGVRGSIPTPGPQTIRYGGNTPCVALWCDDSLLILDAGTGLRVLGEELMADTFGKGQGSATILISHTHWDHIQGFPFFRPAYIKGNSFGLCGVAKTNKGLETAMHHQQEYRNFPVLLGQMPSRIAFTAIEEGGRVDIDGIRISTAPLNHPGGSCAYRVDYNGKSVVYASDTEHFENIDLRLLTLCRDADLLIYDTMFTPAEYEKHRGWGHSTWQEGMALARQANVKDLHMFHHQPGHSDDDLEKILETAREHFPAIYLAKEGWELTL